MNIDLAKILIRNKRDEKLKDLGWIIETGEDPCLKYDNKYYPIFLLNSELPAEYFAEIHSFFKKNNFKYFAELKLIKAEMTPDNKLFFTYEVKGKE